MKTKKVKCMHAIWTISQNIHRFELIFERFGTANLKLEFPIIYKAVSNSKYIVISNSKYVVISNSKYVVISNFKMENSIQSSKLLKTTY